MNADLGHNQFPPTQLAIVKSELMFARDVLRNGANMSRAQKLRIAALIDELLELYSTGETKCHASSRPEGEAFMCSVCGLDPGRLEYCTRCQGDVTDRTTEPATGVERGLKLASQDGTGSPLDGVMVGRPSR